ARLLGDPGRRPPRLRAGPCRHGRGAGAAAGRDQAPGAARVGWHGPGSPDRRARRDLLGGHVRARPRPRPRGQARLRRLPRRAGAHGERHLHPRWRAFPGRDPRCGGNRGPGRDPCPAAPARHRPRGAAGRLADGRRDRRCRPGPLRPADRRSPRDRRGHPAATPRRRRPDRGHGPPRGHADRPDQDPPALMEVVAGTASLEASLGRLFAVVGVFDGLHLGHDYLLRELASAARGHGARPTVITFDHHPDEVLKGAAPPLLCDPQERLDRLAAAGVAVTVIETFDRALRETTYDAWVGRIAERIDLAGFLMTPESAFGYERGGTPETVAELGRSLGYEVVLVPQFTLDGEPVRSSDIRAAIAAGDLARAERLLGRRVGVTGTVARALRAGTELGFGLPVALPPAGRY